MSTLRSVNSKISEKMAQNGIISSSNDDFDVELYKQENCIASADPTLPHRDYQSRIEIMRQVQMNLDKRVEKQKQKLSLLQTKQRVTQNFKFIYLTRQDIRVLLT